MTLPAGIKPVAAYTPSGWLNGDKTQATLEGYIDDLRAAGINCIYQNHQVGGASFDGTGALNTRPGDTAAFVGAPQGIWEYWDDYDSEMGLYVWFSFTASRINASTIHATIASEIDTFLDDHPVIDGIVIDAEPFGDAQWADHRDTSGGDGYGPTRFNNLISEIRSAHPGVYIIINAPAAPYLWIDELDGTDFTDGEAPPFVSPNASHVSHVTDAEVSWNGTEVTLTASNESGTTAYGPPAGNVAYTVLAGGTHYGFDGTDTEGMGPRTGDVIEFDVQVETGDLGAHNSVWLSNPSSDYSDHCYEIDICEYKNYTGELNQTQSVGLLGEPGFTATNRATSADVVAVTSEDTSWHTYRCELDYGETRIYRDDTLIQTTFASRWDAEEVWGIYIHSDWRTGTVPADIDGSAYKIRDVVIKRNYFRRPITEFRLISTGATYTDVTSITTETIRVTSGWDTYVVAHSLNNDTAGGPVNPTVSGMSATGWTEQCDANDGSIHAMWLFSADSTCSDGTLTIDWSGDAGPQNCCSWIVFQIPSNMSLSNITTHTTSSGTTYGITPTSGSASNNSLVFHGARAFRGGPGGFSPGSETESYELSTDKDRLAWVGAASLHNDGSQIGMILSTAPADETVTATKGFSALSWVGISMSITLDSGTRPGAGGNNWSDAEITSFTSNIDTVSPMIYDYSETPTQSDGAAYQEWFVDVINRYDTNKTTGVDLVPSVPAQNTTSSHDPSIENLTNAYAAIYANHTTAQIQGSAAYWWQDWDANTTDDTAETIAFAAWLNAISSSGGQPTLPALPTLPTLG